MSTELDDEIIPQVVDLLATYGKNATFLEEQVGHYNPTTGTRAPTATKEHVVKVTPPLPYTKGYKQVDQQTTQAQCYCAGPDVTFDLKLQMVVTLDGKFRISSFTPIYTGEQIALYMLILES